MTLIDTRGASRVQRFLGARSGAGQPGATEATGGRAGPPDERDTAAIAAKLRQATDATPSALEAVGGLGIRRAASDSIAAMLVERARDAIGRLDNGASPGSLRADDLVALESVMNVRGRPALGIEGERIEALDDTKHPGSGFWRTLFNNHEDDLVATARATGAVMVRDVIAGGPAWVQGTAWLIAPGRVMTNRHVLFPPLDGVRLARRDAANRTQATMKSDYEVVIDFAYDTGPARVKRCTVTSVPYVSEAADPIDVAVLDIARQDDGAKSELTIATAGSKARQLYVVGHPGRMTDTPDEVLAVFGNPDGKKRVSFGEVMAPETPRPGELAHDASTIGGFSGGCVLAFGAPHVAGLHYYGDPLSGNRAITAAALRQHAVAAFIP
jgi:hypothetical protein